MGRTILADENIQTYVEKLLKSDTWYLGLIIGKLTNQKDHAVVIVRTPEPCEDKADDDGEEQGETTEKKSPRRKSQSKPESLDDIDEQWAATHAKQVTMMLPGGLSVIGIFAVASPNMMQSAQAKLRQVMFAIQKQEKKSLMTDSSDPLGDRLLLQICSTTRKYTCRTIDIHDPKSTFRPAEWKFQMGAEKWQRLDTRLAINVPVTLTQKSPGSNLARQIQNGLLPFCQKLWTGFMLVDNNVRQQTQLLNQSVSTEKKGKSRERTQSTQQQTYKCNILLKHLGINEIENPVVEECKNRLVLKGTVCGLAYVNSKATVQDAQSAMRVDLVRSVLSRCELLCDDIQVVEEDAESNEVYSTPRRVFFNLPGTSLQLCDYMFQDEKVSEVKGRVQELLDLTLEEKDIDLSQERPAMEEDCTQLCKELVSETKESCSDIVNTSTGLKYYIVAGVGGLIAAGFAAMSLAYAVGSDT